MTYDYDLVVIGDSPAAAFAAERAGRLRSRVAWVTQVPPGQGNDPNAGDNPALRATVMLQLLRQAMLPLPLGQQVADPQALWAQAQGCAAIAVAEREPQALQQFGVDVIEGLGRFETRPQLCLQVEALGARRELRSRHYLLAPSAHPEIPPQLADVAAVETIHSLPNWATLPQRLIMPSPSPLGLAWAQMLARLGCQVSLVPMLPEPAALLPGFDPELGELVAALLGAAGVDFKPELGWRDLRLQQEVRQGGQSGVRQGSDRLLSMGRFQANWQGLNLEDLGLSPQSPLIPGNRKQRTAHRQIYVCGAGEGPGNPSPAQAKQAAEVALRNALWWPWWKVPNLNDQGLKNQSLKNHANPTTVPCIPALAQVGLTEPQAQLAYPGQVTVVRRYAKDNPQAQRSGDTTGLCKLIVHRNGKLLGAQALAAGAENWIALAALVIQQNGAVKALEQLALPEDSTASLLQSAAAQWRWDRLAANPRREDLIERFFNWRRTGSL